MDTKGRISYRSIGQFNPKDWLTEGDGLLASATKTRETWIDHRRTFLPLSQQQELDKPCYASEWSLLTGLPRASMLLLGYAVEMYLKAGLAKVYRGCSERMFHRDLKALYRHQLVCLANAIAFPIEEEDEDHLRHLEKMVLVDARYPIFVPKGRRYSDAINEQTARIWSPKNFESFTSIAVRVKEHSQKIDSDSTNPASHCSVSVDNDGYLAFRVGGNLPPRITYRLSTVQKRHRKTGLSDIKALFHSPGFRQLNHYWERAWIYEDGEHTTTLRRSPSA